MQPARPSKKEGVKAEAPPDANGEPAVPKPTHVDAHHVVFYTGTEIKLKVSWLHGIMYATSPELPASFDDTNSFRLSIERGLITVNLDDLSAFLKNGALKNSLLKNAKLSPQNGLLKITGTLKKVVPIPVQMLGRLSVAPDRIHIRMHVEKLSALKVPVKGLLGAFKIKVDDLFDPKGTEGIEVKGDDIDLDVNRLLPPPHAKGTLSAVRVLNNGDLMQFYGTPGEDDIQARPWHNFMRLRGGVINFGKLTMHNADLLMVDTSQSDWLNFDVKHYQDQLVNGDTRITPNAGLQLFIPDINKLPKSARKGSVSSQWLKSRNLDPPPDVQ